MKKRRSLESIRETVGDPPGTHYADSKNIIVRSIVGTDTDTTWRMNVRNLLKSARDRSADVWRKFGYGIIYDVVGWTPGHYSREMYETLLECGSLLAKKRFGKSDLLRMRNQLENAGFNLVPEWKTP